MFRVSSSGTERCRANTKQSRVNSDAAAQLLASSPKHVLKSTVFSYRRKAASDCSSLTAESSMHGQLQLETHGHPGSVVA